MSAMADNDDTVIVRELQEEDCEQLFHLMQEQATYQKIEPPLTSPAALRRNGFGTGNRFKCLVAAEGSQNNSLVGYVLYHINFSSWHDRNTSYLEDLFVTEKKRRQGVGTLLWKALCKVSVENDCLYTDWVTSEHNTNAQAFYKSKGGVDMTVSKGFRFYSMDIKNMQQNIA